MFKAAKDRKPFVLDWNDETAFIKHGQSVSSTSLKADAVIVIYYKNVSFRNSLLKKVVWEERQEVK